MSAPSAPSPFSAYRIREARQTDIRPALQMRQQAWRETYAGLRPESFFVAHESRLEAEVQWWEAGLAAGAGFLIAEHPTAGIIGIAGATPALPEDAETGVSIEIGMLYVLAAYDRPDSAPSGTTNTGSHSTQSHTTLSDRLLETLLLGRDALVWVLEQSASAREFYVRHGFHPDGTGEDLQGEWAGLREIRMVRRRARPDVT